MGLPQAAAIFLIVIVSALLLLALFVACESVVTPHPFSCLCEKCKKDYIKNKQKVYESTIAIEEWHQWRKIVDDHFQELEAKQKASR